ncbi:hypothetical protein G9464_19870 [Halostella sp. JP-L12]|uniref:DUF7519 family protein n=1 Tax=Halostella TaxID=1843185 RepID=UPI000EF7E90A|nr:MULTISPECIES: hypothetical protein [Halostella]NHN49829.1 hypothetical protein [Halostella sp. JP-L12]
MSATVRDHDDRPTPVGAVLAVVAALAAVVVVANAESQLFALGVEVVAVAAIGAGAGLRERGRDAGRARAPVGWLLLLVGVGAAAAAVALAITEPERLSRQLELVPGLLGVTALALGVRPASRRKIRARYLVGTGAALVVIAAFTSGVIYGAGRVPLLAATALAVLAWDAGEQSISLGEQVGRRGKTAAVAVVHVGAAAVVGVAAVALAGAVYAMNVTGVSLLALVLLLGAAIVLAVALYA